MEKKIKLHARVAPRIMFEYAIALRSFLGSELKSISAGESRLFKKFHFMHNKYYKICLFSINKNNSTRNHPVIVEHTAKCS